LKLYITYRVLREGGFLIVCTVNKEWRDFYPSKYSTTYYSMPGLKSMLEAVFTEVKFHVAFEVKNEGLKVKLVSVLERGAFKLNLIPDSLRARDLLRRIFLGKLAPIPNEVHEGMAGLIEPIEMENRTVTGRYKVLYAVAKK
jgi:hypothetical protein